MKEIIVNTQAQYDALPQSFTDYTVVTIKETNGLYVQIVKVPTNAHVEAWGSSHVEAWGSSHVVAWGSSHVVARGSSHVEAWESSHVEAWESSHVVAWGSSHVVARESSHVEAWESSHVEARGSSHVEARGSSHVEAWGSSHVEAWGNVSVHLHSDLATVILFMFAVCIALAKGKIQKKSKAAVVVTPEFAEGVNGWLEGQGVEGGKTVILFKRVSVDFKTQENTSRETLWHVGSRLEHPQWAPESGECGAGKFHACSRPYFCDEFRNEKRDDRYIAIQIRKADLYAWPHADYPHKIAFRAGKVLYECDRLGNELKRAEAIKA